MNIIIAASEIFPFCKTGGLADVAGSLAQVFSRVKGNNVAVFLPRYRNIGAGSFSLKAVPGVFRVPVGDKLEPVSLSHAQWGNVSAYFIECPKYFDRTELYRTKTGDFQDNDERFILFSRAVLEGAKFIGLKPDIIHCHDWQTGLIPAYLKTLYSIDAFFARTSSVMTVHNISYQGFFPRETFFKAGFGWVDFTPQRLEYYGGINFLKAGMVYADHITTVSSTYGKEILGSEEFGKGLAGVLRSRASSFAGIVNGIDTELWDPEHDSYIPRGYYENNFPAGKAEAKKKLQASLGLEQNPNIMLAGVISRLDYQKGLDFVISAIPKFADKIQFVILGMGDQHLYDGFAELAKKYPQNIAFRSAMDEGLAHNIYAASDIFIMPSRFEPCGLSQLIAMRYGALPVVARTGGLADTVCGYGCAGQQPITGFFIENPNPESLAKAIDQSIEVFKDKKLWGTTVRNAMQADFSWDKSAQVYTDLFGKLVRKKA